jgi:hypothetical protein
MAEIHLSKRARAAAEGGGPASPAYEAVQAFHTNADVDADTNALHHTVGSQPAQASPGDHTHDGGSSSPILQGTTISGVRGTAAYQASLEAALVRLGASSAATG